MPKLGYGYAHYPGSPSSLPSDISGLRLWLKADAGVKFGSYVKEITLTGSAGGLGDGVFTREDAGTNGLASFSSSNASIFWDNENLRWYSGGEGGSQLYSNFSPVFAGDWNLEDGGSPAPTASYKFFSPSQNNITTWEDQSGNKNHFTGYNAQLFLNQINGKSAVYFNPNKFPILTSPTTIFDGLTAMSFIAVCYVTNDSNQALFFDNKNNSVFQITITEEYPISVDVGGFSFMQSTGGTNFFQQGAFHINYLDATTANGSAYQDGIASVNPFVSQFTLTGSGTTTSDGVYTRTSGGTTQLNGPNGNYIYWDGIWNLYDASASFITYRNVNIIFEDEWSVYDGDPDAPSQTGTITSYESAVTPGSITMPFTSGASLSMSNNTMNLAELIIYNKRLSTTERKQIEGYLNAKYAIY